MDTETTAFAAAIRDQAPGRTERDDHAQQTSGVESARAIRDAAPGRTAR